jgi:hypothetical protein
VGGGVKRIPSTADAAKNKNKNKRVRQPHLAKILYNAMKFKILLTYIGILEKHFYKIEH